MGAHLLSRRRVATAPEWVGVHACAVEATSRCVSRLSAPLRWAGATETDAITGRACATRAPSAQSDGLPPGTRNNLAAGVPPRGGGRHSRRGLRLPTYARTACGGECGARRICRVVPSCLAEGIRDKSRLKMVLNYEFSGRYRPLTSMSSKLSVTPSRQFPIERAARSRPNRRSRSGSAKVAPHTLWRNLPLLAVDTAH